MAQAGIPGQGEQPVAGSDRVRLLGGFALVRAGRPLSIPEGGQRLVALLALLGARTRNDAATLLWPAVPGDRAAGNLRSALWRLGRVWPGLVEAEGQRLQLTGSVDVDSREFLRRVRAIVRGHTPLDTADGPTDDARGVPELLPGWFEDWVLDERDRIRQLALQVLELMSEYELQRRRYGAALEAAMEAVRAEPLRESAHRAVIRVHLAQGNVVQARAHLNRLADLFRRELGVLPSPMTRRLFDGSAQDAVPDDTRMVG